MKEPTDLITNVIVSEKATRLTEEGNQYVFRVWRNARKPQIKEAIEQLFKTKVTRVSTMRMPGKTRRGATRYPITQAPWKKAVVHLAEGEKIDLA